VGKEGEMATDNGKQGRKGLPKTAQPVKKVQMTSILATLFSALLFTGPMQTSGGSPLVCGEGRKGLWRLTKMAKPVKTLLNDLTLTVVYDNHPYRPSLPTAWGFSCLIEGPDKTILFDTGGDGAMLLSNMRKLGIDPAKIDIIVLSHIHGDHVGGLAGFLRSNPDVAVYLPKSFPRDFKEEVGSLGANVVEGSGPAEICTGVYSTGELGTHLPEQSLIIAMAGGSVIITGCAHPGIVRIVREARDITASAVRLVLGGVHLLGDSRRSIEKIISQLKAMNVEHVAPCHCSGDIARDLFRMAWGADYLDVGVGRVISIRGLPGKRGDQ
jgi:7,8-dihydropterin-6-yl-methyl-4-(beta-D-ribofuranosyl)aminobenzene 5'-phosphate synthase